MVMLRASSSPRLGALALALVLALAPGCDRPPPLAPPAPPPASPSATPPPTPEPTPAVQAVAPALEVPWTPPERALSERERGLVGTWTATVDARATQTAFMSGMVGLGLPAGQTGNVLDVVAKGERLALDQCHWLELREGFRGFRSECMLGPDGPSALEGTNPLTGEKSDLGTAFDWYLDGEQLRLRTDGDLVVLRAGADGAEKLTFRQWTLTLDRETEPGWSVTESVPTYGYTLPAAHEYQVFPGAFLGGG